MANEVYYVVFIGRKRGIDNSWPECQEQVVGYKGNVCKLYKMFEEARWAWVFYEPRWNCTKKHIYAKPRKRGESPNSYIT